MSKASTLEKAQAFGRSHPDMDDGGNPWFVGWVAWAAFHLTPASETLAVLGLSEKYGALHHVLMTFCINSLVARNIDKQRVLYLRGVYFKDKQVAYDADGEMHPYDENKTFLLPVTAFENTASTSSALLWIEGGEIEIFSSYTIEGNLGIAVNNVISALPTTWPNSPKFRKTIYTFPREILKSSNYWNTYFLFLRTQYNKQKVMQVFSPKYANLQSLEQRRDVVVQTCGRLIADCAERLNKVGYDGYFGPEGEPFMLSMAHINEILNIFTRCYNVDNKLWSIFTNILPDLAPDAGAPLSGAKAVLNPQASGTQATLPKDVRSSLAGLNIQPLSINSGISKTTAPSLAISQRFQGDAKNNIPLLHTPGPATFNPTVIANPPATATWPGDIDPKYNNFREIPNATAMVFLSP